MLKRLNAFVSASAHVLALVGMLGLIGMVLLTAVDVLMRWLLNQSIEGAAEIDKLLILIVVAAFFPLSLVTDSHVTIRFVGDMLGRAAKHALEILGALATLGFFAALGWQIVLYTIDLASSGETTWVLRWQVTPWWIAATGILLLCIPVQLIVLAWLVRTGQRTITPPAGDPEIGV
jgi:TRAP-type transport system small permease protein